MLRNHAHVLVAVDRRFPVAFYQLRVALDEGFARDRDAVRPAVRFGILDEVIELVKALFEKTGDEWIRYNGRVRLTGEQRFPGVADRTVLVADLPLYIAVRIDSRAAKLVLIPHGGDA